MNIAMIPVDVIRHCICSCLSHPALLMISLTCKYFHTVINCIFEKRGKPASLLILRKICREVLLLSQLVSEIIS